jgi:hypothetical protein
MPASDFLGQSRFWGGVWLIRTSDLETREFEQIQVAGAAAIDGDQRLNLKDFSPLRRLPHLSCLTEVHQLKSPIARRRSPDRRTRRDRNWQGMFLSAWPHGKMGED